MKTTAVIVAAGSGIRMGAGRPKQFLELEGKPILEWTLRIFENHPAVSQVVLVVPKTHLEAVRTGILDAGGFRKVAGLVPGGSTRQESVQNGLMSLGEDVDVVLIHDGVRPFASPELVSRLIEEAARSGAAVPALPVSDTVKEVAGASVVRTVPRENLVTVQTPQAFRREVILEAYRNLSGPVTDDSAAVEALGVEVVTVEGETNNFKITRPGDLERAAAQAGRGCRCGFGFDFHPLAEGRVLVLGGVRIEHRRGLAGYSDADVLVHAVMDALLGAAGLPDIGQVFPDSDERYRGAFSIGLLEKVVGMLREKGLSVVNVDTTVVAEEPRISPYVAEMKDNLAGALGIPAGSVGLKATTMEGRGLIGRGEGIAAYAVAVVK